MIMRLALCVSGALLLLVTPAMVSAHAFLVKSNPAVGATAAAKPAALTLEFSEAIELGFSGVEVSNASGPLALKGLGFADTAHKVLLATLPIVAPGLYSVKWHVVSVDTHRTEGEYTFTVKP
jgi:methionine-rich copper-binding protein CopC